MLRPITAALVLVPLFTACGGPAGDGDGTIKVGAIFDFTGPTADVGTVWAEGVRGYFAWLQEQGGIDGRPVRLIFQDYGGEIEIAEKHYSQFVEEGAVAFLGWGAADTEALRERVASDRIPFMSASYSHVLGDPREAPYNFLAGTSYSDQLGIVLDWILENHTGEEPPTVALMHSPGPSGLSAYEHGGRDHATRRGIRLSVYEMAQGSTDYSAELTSVHASGAGYVIFQNAAGPVATALENARALGLDPAFFCLDPCAHGGLIELAGEAADGVIGAVIFSPPGAGASGLADAQGFLAARGGSIEEKGLIYGQGWVTAAVMSEGIRRALAAGGKLSGEKVRRALETLKDFETGGVTSPITYGPEDHLGARGLRLFEVRGGVWRPLTGFRTASG